MDGYRSHAGCAQENCRAPELALDPRVRKLNPFIHLPWFRSVEYSSKDLSAASGIRLLYVVKDVLSASLWNDRTTAVVRMYTSNDKLVNVIVLIRFRNMDGIE